MERIPFFQANTAGIKSHIIRLLSQKHLTAASPSNYIIYHSNKQQNKQTLPLPPCPTVQLSCPAFTIDLACRVLNRLAVYSFVLFFFLAITPFVCYSHLYIYIYTCLLMSPCVFLSDSTHFFLRSSIFSLSEFKEYSRRWNFARLSLFSFRILVFFS